MLREIYYQFLPYRSYFVPLLIMMGITAPCWLALRLYMRRSGTRPSFVREILLFIFVVYVGALATATLSPNRSSRLIAEGRGGIDLRPSLATLTCSAAMLPAGSSRGFCQHNMRANAALFFPLGLLLPLIWVRARFWRGLQIALALSVGIEVVQYLSSAWGSYRAADVNDVILNVGGAALGLVIVSLVRSFRGKPTEVAPA